MSEQPAVQHGNRAVAVLLTIAATYPVAIALEARDAPGGWPLLAALLAGAVAYGGASALPTGHDGAHWRSIRRLVVLVTLGGSADVAWRLAVNLLGGWQLTAFLVGGSTVLAACLAPAGWWAGSRLARRLDAGATSSLPPGNVLPPVGPALLAGGVVALSGAGWAHWGVPLSGWRAATTVVSLGLYAVVSMLHLQRLRRSALLAGWERTNSAVQPAVLSHWTIWVFLAAGFAVAVTALWWIPPAEPVREGADQASRQIIAWLAERANPRTGGPPRGEIIAYHDDLRQDLGVGSFGPGTAVLIIGAVAVIVIGALLQYLRTRRGRRPDGRQSQQGAIRQTARWWRILWAVIVAMLRPGSADVTSGPPAGRASPRRTSRRLRRPGTPREQVIHAYRRVLDRAERRGLPRRPTQSASVYAVVLSARLPQHADAVEELTAHFNLARYSRHPIDRTAADRCKQTGRALRAAL